MDDHIKNDYDTDFWVWPFTKEQLLDPDYLP